MNNKTMDIVSTILGVIAIGLLIAMNVFGFSAVMLVVMRVLLGIAMVAFGTIHFMETRAKLKAQKTES